MEVEGYNSSVWSDQLLFCLGSSSLMVNLAYFSSIIGASKQKGL